MRAWLPRSPSCILLDCSGSRVQRSERARCAPAQRCAPPSLLGWLSAGSQLPVGAAQPCRWAEVLHPSGLKGRLLPCLALLPLCHAEPLQSQPTVQAVSYTLTPNLKNPHCALRRAHLHGGKFIRPFLKPLLVAKRTTQLPGKVVSIHVGARVRLLHRNPSKRSIAILPRNHYRSHGLPLLQFPGQTWGLLISFLGPFFILPPLFCTLPELKQVTLSLGRFGCGYKVVREG